MNPTFHHLEVGDVSSLSVRLPVVTLGSGRPILTCLCGVHGDETTSVAAVYRVVERMKTHADFHGSIRFVTAANPLAQAVRARLGPVDLLDLNRCGRGMSEGSLTKRVAHVLGGLLGESNFVVDLHEFEMETPTMAIFVPSGEPPLDNMVLSQISAFGPETVWAMDVARAEEATYRGSLLSAALAAGVPGFAVETSHAWIAADSAIDAVAAGLVRVAQRLGIVQGTPRLSQPVAYRRQEMTAKSAGLWLPARQPLQRVEAGSSVGRIVGLDLVNSTNVKSPVDGIIVQIARRTLVGTGSSVFALGIVDETTTAALRQASA